MAHAPSPQVAEIVTFTLNEGVTDVAFLTTLRATQSWLDHMPGFRGRQVTKGPDGSWTDHIIWDCAAQAEAARESFGQQPFAPQMGRALRMETVVMRHEAVFMAAP